MVTDVRPAIVHVVHSLDGGGTERTLVALLRAFSESDTGIRHVVITLREAGSLAARLPDAVACHALQVPGRSRWSAVRLANAVRACRGTIIHARNTGTWIDAMIAWALCPATRLVLGFHGLEHSAPIRPRVARCARWAARLGARFTAVCDAAARQLHEQTGVPAERITTLRNGVDLDRFAPYKPTAREALRRRLGIAASAGLVGTVGSLTPIKQHDLLIESMAHLATRHRPLHLAIVGDGPMRQHLVERAAGLGIEDRVHLLGHREDVAEILPALDAYACSSAMEGLNNALLEAMAAGLPCVATNVGGNPELICDRREGRLVAPGRPRDMAEAIAWLFDSPGRLATIAVEARRRAEAFDCNHTVRNYERHYRGLIRGCRRSPGQARPSRTANSVVVR